MTAAALSTWGRRARNTGVVLLALVAVYALVGFFLLPSLAKSKLETLAVEGLGRHATVGRVEFNPFTLRARLSEFALIDREPGRTLLKFDTLDLDLSPASLWHWAPVLDAVRLVHPSLALVRHDDGSYNVQDLIDWVLSPPAGPTPLFSINNIEIDGGSISLDDQPHRRTVAVTDLGVGIPFLSSVPHDAKVRVTPRLEGTLDGAHFVLSGNSTTPFADTQEATLAIDLDGLALPRYAEYAPLPQELKLVDGALTTRLKLAFATEKGTPRTVTLSGSARIDRLAIARRDGSPLAAARTIEASVSRLDLLRRSAAIDRLAVDAPDVALRRSADGEFELARLLAPLTGRTPPHPQRPEGAGRRHAAMDIHARLRPPRQRHAARGRRGGGAGVSRSAVERRDRRTRDWLRTSAAARSMWRSIPTRARISVRTARSICRGNRRAGIFR